MSTGASIPIQRIRCADWTRNTAQSALQQMLSAASHPDVISFALGLPAAELFPKSDYAQAALQVLETDSNALQYSPPLQQLRSQIVKLMALRGVSCREGQIFLTSGAQQGMSLLCRLLLNPGGKVFTEELTYTGLSQAIEPFAPEVVAVPTTPDEGMDADGLERLLGRGERPAFIYAISDGHNPLGVSLRRATRERIVALARKYSVPIIEDDAYGFLRYDGNNLPPLKALDEEWVFYVGSFSKILAPSLRVGWIVAPEALIPVLSVIKEASDINTATFTQRTVAAYLAMGRLPDHLARLRKKYGARRDSMIEALREHFPADAQWIEPRSGVFIWVDLGGRIDTNRLLKTSIETERVAFIPGHAFSVGKQMGAANCIRMNFSNSSPERIEEGVARLGRVVKAFRVLD